MTVSFNSKEEFYSYLYNEIKAESRIEGEEKFEEEVFVERMIEYLHESNTLENASVCRHRSLGLKVDGYDINTTGNSIDLLVAHFVDEGNEIPKISKPAIQTAFKRAKSFLEKSRIGTGMRELLDESNEALDLANLIHSNFRNLKRSRIILLTNGITGAQPAFAENIGNFEISYQVWDFDRLWRSVSSGMKKEVITVEFLKEGYDPIPALSAYDGMGVYTTYISLIPGQLLSDLYDRYGTRLLERNVRAFLQARSNVNRGIRDTIIESPNMFLAYNNGITVTAQSVGIIEDTPGNECINSIKDFQVVNGGQTTASLWHTSTKNKANLKNVFLLMKLTVVNKAEMVDEIAPLISKYSNAQNKVNTADFSANTSFHRNLERIGLSIWAPDPKGGNINTKWFYERSRGSYLETRALERTPARIKAWDRGHPRSQQFDKIMLAKIENTWRLLPHIVSLGGQKCFSHFTVYIEERIEDEKEITVDENFFKDIIAKLIIWKSTEKLINKQKIPGYRANIVTYSLSWLITHHPELFDLNKIWNEQAIGEGLSKVINYITFGIRNVITNVDGNVTEWCKKEACWDKIQNLKIDINEANTVDPNVMQPIVGKKPAAKINWAIFTQSDVWIDASEWIERTGLLKDRDAEFCRSIGNLIKNGKNPSVKQIPIAIRIMENAVREGFTI